jgi:Cu-processing system permease protein
VSATGVSGALGRIFAIALNTSREAARNRVVYAIGVLAILLMAFVLVLGEMSQNEEARVARDLTLAAISFFGSVTAGLLGVVLLYGEIQRKTIHPIVAKPLERWEFVVGKYLGIAMTLTMLVVLFAVTLMIVLWVQDVPITAAVGKAILLSYFEVLVVAAIAVFFSSFSTPFLSGVFTFVLFFLGRVTPEMRAALESTESSVTTTLLRGALRAVPDLHLFAISGRTVEGQHVSVNGEFVSWGYVATTVGYGVAVIAALLVLSALIFQRRDFV